MDNLLQKLTRLGDEAEAEFPHLNHGGCGLFAAVVGKRLQELGVNVRIFVCGQWSGHRSVDFYRPEDNLDGAAWDKNGLPVAHCGVEFVYKHVAYRYDSNGTVKAADDQRFFRSYYILSGRLTVEEMEAIAAYPPIWNSMFARGNRQRKANQAKLESLIKEYL